VQWFLTDNIHSIRQVVSSGGSVLDALTYDPYGNIVSQTNAANAPRFLYAGGAYDSLTGYDQFGRRYYSPVDGRWTSQDPLGFAAGDANLYRYTFNQPINLNDPSGDVIGIIAIGIGIYLAGALIYKYSNWSIQNQSSTWALTMTYARWGRAGGQILMAGGLTIAAAPAASWLAGTSPYVAAGMFGVGTCTTAVGVYNTYTVDHTGWGVPEYVGAYGSLAAPWVVGAGWYAGYKGGYLPGPVGGYRPPGGAPGRTVGDVLKDGGKSIGPPGRSRGVVTVGSEAELQGVFKELTQGGTVVPSGTYPGTVVKMPDGSFVRMRGASKSGGATIDITGADGKTLKVHIDPP
jgi:RHS repeat-associated protein